MPFVDYFIAADDTSASLAIDAPGGPESGGYETIDAKGVDPLVVLGNLESILLDRTYADVLADPRHGHLLTDSERDDLVVTVTDTLRDGLAAADGDRLRAVAEEWVQTAELAGSDSDALTELLAVFAALADRAVRQDWHIYCWWAL